jgi:transcriptional regulator with XRE-family HTH domain
MTAGDRLMQIRLSHNWNQTQMAKMLNVSPSLISEIERGAKQPSKKLLLSCKQNLPDGVDIDWILTGFDTSASTIEEQSQKIGELEAALKIRDDKLDLLERLIRAQDNELALWRKT